MNQEISAEFPFQSKYVTILGSRMHYVDEGEGDPILFLHGNPTSSYLWRNIIPYVSPLGRAIAPDMIGMGKSDKPDLAYRFRDHYQYLEAFIKELELDDITLVVHDWGSGLGFHFAAQHPDRIKAIAFMEALVRPLRWSDWPAEYRTPFKLMRTTGIGWLMVSVANLFVKQLLPEGTVRELTEEETAYYGQPYQTIASRKPVRQWPCEIPFEGQPADVYQVINNYSQWLQESRLPKLLFHASPGALLRDEMVAWLKENLANLTTVDVGQGVHFIQEDHPHLIGERLAAWYSDLTGAAHRSQEAQDERANQRPQLATEERSAE